MFSNNIHNVVYPSIDSSLLTLISGDFSDAYTQSSLEDLQQSITKLGALVSWENGKIGLSIKLARLVFENCYFETPTGIHRQSKGFPMGGHSSREGLDNILLAGEVELLRNNEINYCLQYYYRLVDDISTAIKGSFGKVKEVIQEMSTIYPKTMPLNIQISFGYSKFLDCHISKLQQCKPVNNFSSLQTIIPFRICTLQFKYP